jgi:4-amino-4-deoxy-L-arabinose transferase-like glycosyltransferase
MAERGARRLSLALALLVAGLLSLPALLPRAALANVFFDDAFYYFVIARRLVETGRLTFDGIHATNGYQPLWLFVMTPLFAIFGNHEAPLRAVVIVQALLSGGSAYLISQTLGPRVGRAPAGIAALSLVAIPTLQRVVASGMESALMFLWLILIWRAYLAVKDNSSVVSSIVGLGVLCALAFLTRPEAIVAPLVLAGALHHRRRLGFRRAAQLGLPVVLAVAAYLSFNLLTSGVALPTSGLVKSNGEIAALKGAGSLVQRLFASLPIYAWTWSIFGPNEQLVSWLSWSLIVGLLAMSVLYRRRLRLASDRAGVALPLTICALFWIVQTCLLRFTAPWYAVWTVLALALLLGALTASLRWAQLILYAFVLVAVARGAIHTRRSLANSRLMETEVIAAASWMKAQLRAGQAVGSWNAGLFAYYCDCAVVNLDGLVNDQAFYRQVIVSKGLVAYLGREQIDWLADEILTPQSFDRPTFGLTTDQLANQPLLLVRSFCRAEDPACNGFGVWRLAR